MKDLGLAFPIKVTEENEDENETVMIPCLIDDTGEGKVKEIRDKVETSENSVCLMYKFNHDASTIDIYFKLLQEFSKNDFVMKGGSFDLGFSQKIENRKPGKSKRPDNKE